MSKLNDRLYELSVKYQKQIDRYSDRLDCKYYDKYQLELDVLIYIEIRCNVESKVNQNLSRINHSIRTTCY